MIIRLPEPRLFKNWKGVNIENTNLYLNRSANFESVMKRIVYSNYGKVCPYCGKKMRRTTIDHKYPRHYGGPSIPDNMVVCCPECNSEKGDLTSEQFLKYMELSILEKDAFRKECIRSTEELIKQVGYILPQEWIDITDMKKIKGIKKFENTMHDSTKIKNYFREFGNLCTPFVISSNYYPLTNEQLLTWLSKKSKIVSAIRLENVFYYEK